MEEVEGGGIPLRVPNSDHPHDQEHPECRICGGPAEESAPLFYPCKCSGTIRYIHQDCLTTWLTHSKKRSCDVCKHPYSFTKVYKPNMPRMIPPTIFIKRVGAQIISSFVMGVRAWLVVFVWLILVPLCTIWMWRVYFWSGELLAWAVYGLTPEERHSLPMNGTNSPLLRLLFFQNGTINPHIFTDMSLFASRNHTFTEEDWTQLRDALGADIFQGQIITSSIVIFFLAMFLLREWIIQNAAPGIFGDEAAQAPNGEIDVAPMPELEPIPAPPQQVEGRQDAPPPAVNLPETLPNLIPQPDRDEIFRPLQREMTFPRDGDAGPSTNRKRPAEDDGQLLPTSGVLGDVGVRGEAQRVSFAEGASEKLAHPSSAEGSSEWPEVIEHLSYDSDEERDNRLAGNRKYAKARGLPGPLFATQPQQANPFALRAPPMPFAASTSPVAGPSLFAAAPSQMDDQAAEQTRRLRQLREQYFNGPASTPAVQTNGSSTFAFDFASAPSSFNLPRSRESTPAAITPTPNFPLIPAPSRIVSPDTADSRPTPSSSRARKDRSGRVDKGKGKAGSSNAGVDRDALAAWANSNGESSAFQIPTNFSFDFTLKDAPVLSAPIPGPSAPLPLQLNLQDHPFNTQASFSEPHPAPLSSSFAFGTSTPITHKSSNTDSPRRPPLPPTTPITELPPPTPRPSHIFPVNSARQLSNAGMPSPNLAIYRAPEELDAASREGYFYRAQQPEEVAALEELRQLDQDIADDARAIEEEVLRARFREITNQAAAADLAANPPLPPAPPLPLQEALPDMLNENEDEEDEEDEEGAGPAGPGDADLEGPMEDDVEGAMEAIGMRGPVFVVFQNAALIMILLDIAIAVGVWIPFTIGKTSLLVSLRPRRGLVLFNIPILLVRKLTDPIVDITVWIIQRFLVTVLLPVSIWIFGAQTVLSASSKAKSLRDLFSVNISKGIKATVGQVRTLSGSSQKTPSWKDKLSLFYTLPSKVATSQSYTKAAWLSESSKQTLYNLACRVVGKEKMGIVNQEIQNFIVQGTKWTDSFIAECANWWVDRAKGTTTVDHMWAVALGYAVTTLGLALYFNTLGAGNVGTVARTVRNAVKQQIIIVKVAVFIIIELVVFPLGCGIVLDFNTLPLFPSGTLARRFAFHHYAPLTNLFYHWMLGTMFMYQFATFLASCRSIMRKGAMWFIKDPQDPNFHPIRDILERKALAHIRKLGTSALMYFFVIAGGFGSVLFALRYQNLFGSKLNPILPLRLNMQQPLAEIPLDLLFLHVIVPPTLHRLRLKLMFRAGLLTWWKFSARLLRLSAYMFGKEHPEEEVMMRDTRSWLAYLKNPLSKDEQHMEVVPPSYIRAPATDALTLPTDQPALILVNKDGIPIKETGQPALDSQDEISRKAGGTPSEDFVQVFIPPNFGYRVLVFLFLLWSLGAVLTTILLSAPIYFGRYAIQLIGWSPVHDAYTFTIGFYFIWILTVLTLEARRQFDRRTNPHRLAFQVVKWVAQSLYLLAAFGVIIPVLLSLVVYLYTILPLRLWSKKHPTLPEISLIEQWTFGVVYMKIGLRLARMTQPPSPFIRAVDRVLAAGWKNPDVRTASRNIIAPVGGGLVMMLVVPILIAVGFNKVFPTSASDLTAVLYIYPGFFAGVAIIQASHGIIKYMKKWTQSIRDTEFLLELKLTNLEKPVEDNALISETVPTQ